MVDQLTRSSYILNTLDVDLMSSRRLDYIEMGKKASDEKINVAAGPAVRAAGEEWVPELTDSVEAQFGGEYSEDTINLVKGYAKPTWMDEPSVRHRQDKARK